MANTTNRTQRWPVGRLLTGPRRARAAGYPALLPDSGLSALETWLRARPALHGDELRALAATIATTADRLSTLVVAAATESDSEEEFVSSLNLEVWAAAVADTATRLHTIVAERYDLEDEETYREAAGHGGRKRIELANRSARQLARDAFDLLVGPDETPRV